ncbi:MAG: entericidin A/B family lipoprotein [Verrucomicrobia bacterium]|nr:entericidin A/B family lipoprotein [Verrucomicrobiota bacterium]MCH8527323.1 entericidin A/B family lipoprotein [Kiritimatiellia bacterium]
MKIFKICMMIGFTLLATTACRETMRGAGEDIEKAGENIQDSAR